MLLRHSTPRLGAELRPAARINVLGRRSCALGRLRGQAQGEMEAMPAANPPLIKMEVVEEGNQKPFARPLPMEPIPKALSNIPLLLFYPALLAAVGASGLGGYMVGKSMPVEKETQDAASYGAAALLGCVAAFAAVQIKKQRDSAAVVDLYNSIAELGDPTRLSSELVSGVGAKYGINLQKEELDGLQRVYGEYLSCIVPKGDTQLKGDEASKLLSFMAALGISEEEAAPMHLEVGRKMYRDGFETKNRKLQGLNRRAFQRLVYVSAIMFGDQRASVLVPWSQHFNLSDAQLFVARRDNAKAIFKAHLEGLGVGFPADRAFLQQLREYQAEIKLMDESAEELVKEYSRKHIEVILLKAIDCIRRPGKAHDSAGACVQLKKVIDYSHKLARLSHEDGLIPGLGVTSIHGGSLLDPETGGKAREMRELYTTYMGERLAADKSFSEELDADMKDLQAILCISAKEASELRDETAAGLYKSMLKEAVQSKRLQNAESPATVLQELCQTVRFSPEAAMQLHRELYTGKLRAIMDEKKTLTAADEEEMSKIRRMLCLTNDVAQKAQMEVVGKQMEGVLNAVFDLGMQAVPEPELVRIEQTIKDLRIETDVALMVMKKATVEKFRSYIKGCQKAMEKGDRKASALLLKDLIQFNALVVSPVLERIKGTDAAAKELAELLMQAQEMAAKEGKEGAEAAAAVADVVKAVEAEEALKGVQKALQASRGEFSDDDAKGQKEISLKDDLDPEKRAELYKQYLILSMQGDGVELPLGGIQQKKKKEDSSRGVDMARLSQLGDILGMSQMEVGQAHQGLSKDAYKNQATEVMRSGPLNEERNAYLVSMQSQLGLTKEAADEVLKEVRTDVYGTANAYAEDGSSWTLDRVLEARKAGKSLDGVVEEVTRRNLFRRELQQAVSDGCGELDSEYILKKLPEILQLEKTKVDRVVKEMVGSRRRTLLVQAVSQVRQKRATDALVSLNNLISCTRVMPDPAMPWNEKQEIMDVFQSFVGKEPNMSKQSLLQEILGLTDDEANELRNASVVEESERTGEEDEAFF